MLGLAKRRHHAGGSLDRNWSSSFAERNVCTSTAACSASKPRIFGRSSHPQVISHHQKSQFSLPRRRARHKQSHHGISRNRTVSALERTDREGIIGTKVPIHDPTRLACQILLHLHPSVPRQRHQARLPEMFVQLDDRTTKRFAEAGARRSISQLRLDQESRYVAYSSFSPQRAGNADSTVGLPYLPLHVLPAPSVNLTGAES